MRPLAQDESTKVLSLRLPESLYRSLEESARSRGVTVPALVRERLQRPESSQRPAPDESPRSVQRPAQEAPQAPSAPPVAESPFGITELVYEPDDGPARGPDRTPAANPYAGRSRYGRR